MSPRAGSPRPPPPGRPTLGGSAGTAERHVPDQPGRSIESEVRGGVTVMRFAGPALADPLAVEAAVTQLVPMVTPGARMLLDFSAVKRLHSAMLAQLVDLHQRLAAVGGRLALCRMRPEVRDFFAVTQTDQLLAIFPDADAALVALTDGFGAPP